MSLVSIKDAIALTGKSRSTIDRAIKSGKLSRTGKELDTSELIRVYGELKTVAEKHIKEPPVEDTEDNGQSWEDYAHEVEEERDQLLIEHNTAVKIIKVLEERIEELKEDKEYFKSRIPKQLEFDENRPKGIFSKLRYLMS